MTLTKRKPPTALKASVVVRTCPWGVFTYDAPVTVSTELLKGRKMLSWRFRCHALNTETGSEWIEVLGVGAIQGTRAYPIAAVALEEVRVAGKLKRECHLCKRTGNKQFVPDGDEWICSNKQACERRKNGLNS